MYKINSENSTIYLRKVLHEIENGELVFKAFFEFTFEQHESHFRIVKGEGQFDFDDLQKYVEVFS